MWRSRISTSESAAVTPGRLAILDSGRSSTTPTIAWATLGKPTSTLLSNQPHSRHHLHLRINISPHEETSQIHSYHHRLSTPRRRPQILRRERDKDRIFRQSSVKEVAGKEVRHDEIERAFYRQYNERIMANRTVWCGQNPSLTMKQWAEGQIS